MARTLARTVTLGPIGSSVAFFAGTSEDEIPEEYRGQIRDKAYEPPEVSEVPGAIRDPDGDVPDRLEDMTGKQLDALAASVGLGNEVKALRKVADKREVLRAAGVGIDDAQEPGGPALDPED